MQNKTLRRTIGVLGASALIGLGMAMSLPHVGAAQDPNQGAPRGRMGGRGPGGPGGPGMGRGGPMGGSLGLDPRDLTDAQREQMKTIRENHAAEIQPLVERTGRARQALAAAVMSGGDLRGPAIDIGNAESELALATAQVEAEIAKLLTPEQRQKIEERRKEMESRRAEMAQRRQSRGAGNGK